MRALPKYLALLCLTAVVTTQSPASAQTLEAELADLVKNHPQIRAAIKTAASSRQEINKSAAGFLPTINLSGDIGPERIDSPAERAEANGNPSSRSRNTATLTVTQNIFNGFATTSASRTARLNKLVNDSTLAITTQQVILDGISAYLDVLRQTQLVELAGQNEDTIQTQLNLEDERVQKGSGIAVDVLQAKQRLQLAKERRIRFEGNLEDAFTRFAQVFDHPPNFDKLVDPVPSADLIPDSLDTAIDIALVENPNILNNDQLVEVAREARRSARADLYPTIDIVGTANYEKNLNATLGTRREFSVLLQANWDLFTGLTTRANVAQAAFDYSASQDNYNFAVREVIQQVRVAWQNLQTTRQRLSLLENAVNIASEVFESRKRLREAGRETVINVLDAESQISNARINFASAIFDEREAVYQLLLSMGRLDLPELEGANAGSGDILQR